MHKNYLGPALLAMILATQPCVASTSDKDRTAKPDKGKVSTSGFSFQVAPPPAWVVPAREESATDLPKAPMHYVLIDRQKRIESGSSTSYMHIVRQVNDSAGLAPAAQIETVFDPSYQRLVLHKFEIVRDGKRIDKLDRKKVQLLQREIQLEARMYDGRVTASLVLDDVRVGDRIDYSYSIQGENPVFGGMLVGGDFPGSTIGPAAVTQYRLLAPEGRAISSRTGPATTVTSTVQAGMRETVFRRTAVPQLQFDPDAPAIAWQDDEIQFSEFGDWAAVAKWGRALFVAPATASKAIGQRADLIRAEAATPEERLLRALVLVQTEIRYFGTEIGASSHRPAAPATVLEQRFGDCKDKVALLVALLAALDIKAAPVLVSTAYQGDVAARLPSPLAFDHVIVRAELDDKVYWLDPTRGHQTGPLAQRQVTGLGKGLVLDPQSSALVDLPGNAGEERVAVNETFRIAKMADAPSLESRITYSGDAAEMIRALLASIPREKFELELVGQYVRIYPKLVTSAPMRIEEQAGRNAITVIQQFSVPDYWRFPEQRGLAGDFALWSVAQALQVPNEPVRKLPFRLRPSAFRHSIAFEFPEPMFKITETKRVAQNDAHFDFQVFYETAPRRLTIISELQILKDRVGFTDWAAFNDKLVKLRPQLVGAVSLASMPLDNVEKMNTQIQALSNAMKKGDPSMRVATKTQALARVREIVLTGQLEGGYLGPKLRAEALAQRAEQRDHLGQMALARADFEEAMKLAPDNAEMIAGAAVNAFLSGSDARARDLSKRALALAPSESGARNTLGYASYFSADYSAALQDWTTLLKDRPDSERLYPAIWLYLTSRRNGEDGVAAVQRALSAPTSQRWPRPVLEWLTGTTNYEQALKAAKEEAGDQSRLCELYFYAGEKALIDGDRAKASELFRKSVATGVVEFNEYHMAQRQLAKLAH